MIDTPRVRKQTRHYNSFEDDELMEFSELDSDSEERPCRTRRLGERSRRYLRAECFRVEKNLLIFGYDLIYRTQKYSRSLSKELMEHTATKINPEEKDLYLCIGTHLMKFAAQKLPLSRSHLKAKTLDVSS